MTVIRGVRIRAGRPIRYVRGSFFWLSVAGAFFAMNGRCLAQALTTPDSARLTVRPREMATGARNDQAGEFPMDSLIRGSSVYVPARCVGARRCPLVVATEGGVQYQRPVADKYGMIFFLVPTSTGTEIVTSRRIRALDESLKHILRSFAIDPDKIAIVGNCHSGPPAIFLGGLNLHVFSRIIALSGVAGPPSGMDTLNKTGEFLIGAGLTESASEFAAVRALRQTGHPVKHLLAIKIHGNNVDEYDFMGHWLQESWATSNPAIRPVPPLAADPQPLLTNEAVSRMTVFWEKFIQEPDSILTIVRRAHLREVIVPVGMERPSVWMTDMLALATKYPSVAAALKQAGLTAQQHEAYRAALISALVAKSVNSIAAKVAADPEFATSYQTWSWAFGAPRLTSPLPARIVMEPASILAKNVEFLETHPDAAKALDTAKLWVTP